MHRFVAGCALSAFAIQLTSAQALADKVLVDFENVRFDDGDTHSVGHTYSAGGYTLTATHPIPGNAEDFSTIGTQSNLFAGSVALFHHGSLGDITLTRDDHAPFDLKSMRLAELPSRDVNGDPVDSGPFDITFHGVKADGTAVEDVVTVNSFLTLKKHAFPHFQDLTSVQWTQGRGRPEGSTHQFDDIWLSDAHPIALLPEPSAAAASLLTFLYCATRRRNS